jgi:cyclophilin family peptidyl-prolyl cis-trans isomerase
MAENPEVVFETNKGKFSAIIFENEAPITSGNFLELVRKKFYDGLTFHRHEPGFVVQGGDPKGDGTGGSDKKIKLEIIPELKHDLGALSMARTNDPDSATSQFFIVVGEAHFLDGKYAVFGQLSSGAEHAMELRKGDKMEKVYVKE